MFDSKCVKDYYKVIEPYATSIPILDILLGYERYKVCHNSIHDSSKDMASWKRFKTKHNIEEKGNKKWKWEQAS